MKKQKKVTSKKTKSFTKKRSVKRLPIAHASKPLLRRLKLLEHKHTGVIVHHKNTSHASLFVLLLIIGLFLLSIGGFSSAYTTGGTVDVSLTVTGPPPENGATILIPVDGQKFIDNKTIEISGACQPKTFVVIRSSGSTIGSTDCDDNGKFSLSAQIDYGDNILLAMNYDNYNQAGPVTSPVIVNLSKSVVFDNEEPIDDEEQQKPITPENPVKIPGDDDCSYYDAKNLSTGGEPKVEVVCLPRLFLPGIEQVLGILVWGGNPPYAISIDLGDKNADPILVSMASPGYKTVSFSYAMPDIYKVFIRMTDHDEKESIVETSVRVSGVIINDSDKDENENIINELVNNGWFNAPVPFYLLAVALTLGFWGGDLFDRRFGAIDGAKKRVA